MVCKGNLAAFSDMQRMSQKGIIKKVLRINTHSCEEHKYEYLSYSMDEGKKWERGIC